MSKTIDLSRWYNLYNYFVYKNYFTHDELMLCMCLLINTKYKDYDTRDNKIKMEMLNEIFYTRFGEKFNINKEY